MSLVLCCSCAPSCTSGACFNPRYSSSHFPSNEALVHQESATKGSDFSDQLLLHANDKIYAAVRSFPFRSDRCRTDDEQAEKWNVRFVSITDCVSAGGCWVGAFLSPYSTNGNPWIVLVCKGTSRVPLTL